MASTPQIISVYPASGALGISLGDSVTVTFDQEMDEDSINTGTFVLAAPDTGIVFGENFNPLDEPGFEDEDILSSPYYGGYVKGTITFSRANASGGIVSNSAVDYTGDGTLWRTVATFTPTALLSPNKKYTAIVAGDEDPTNAFDSGVKTRTVFDPQQVSVSGTGTISPQGGFSGSAQTIYHIKVTTGGTTGNALYEWWDEADPLTVYTGITTTGQRELEDGIYITFSHDGTFVTNDEWKFVVIPPISLPNTYMWEFNTGSGSISIPPSTSSASGIEDLVLSGSGDLEVSSIVPAHYATNLDYSSITSIVVTFSQSLNSSTINGNTVSVYSEPVDGVTYNTSIEYEGDITTTLTVSGAVLTIGLPADVLYENNVVYTTLAKTIASTAGSTLGEEIIYYFTTTYNPLYASARQIRLELGPFVSDLPDDTLNFAIYQAGKDTDANCFHTAVNSSYFTYVKHRYTLLTAELTLIEAILGDLNLSTRMSKTLGDLSVTRGGNLNGLLDKADKLRQEIEGLRAAVQSGGEVSPTTSLMPTSSVKGASADDAITVYRLWEPSNSLGGYNSGANDRSSISDTRETTTTRRGFRSWRKKF